MLRGRGPPGRVSNCAGLHAGLAHNVTEEVRVIGDHSVDAIGDQGQHGGLVIDGPDRNEPAWDTAERRQQLAESLEGKGDREAANSRLLADKHQGTHPSAAVAQKPSLATTSKMAKLGGKGKALERGGLER